MWNYKIKSNRTFDASILASICAFRIKFTNQRSAWSSSMFNFSANILMEIFWWMRQNISKINWRACSMKSSAQCDRKKSLLITCEFTKRSNEKHKFPNDTYLSTLAQFLLCTVEVIAHMQTHQQLGDRIGIVVFFLRKKTFKNSLKKFQTHNFDDFNEFLQIILSFSTSHNGDS